MGGSDFQTYHGWPCEFSLRYVCKPSKFSLIFCLHCVYLYGLSTIALYGLLMQDCSAGACERNWSSYSLIHTKIRNRLSTSQFEKLVYYRANMRLMRSYHALGSPKHVEFKYLIDACILALLKAKLNF